MPRPDIRKLAADRLGTPEPMSGRIAALLGIDERLFDTLLPVAYNPVTTPVRPTSRSGSTPFFTLPVDVTADAPVQRGIRPAPRSRSFTIPAAMLRASVPSILSVASAPVAAPVSAPSDTTGRKRPLRRSAAASSVLSVASAPVVAPASAPSRTGSERKRPTHRKSVVATARAARGPVIETALTDRERRAIAAAILGPVSTSATPAAVEPTVASPVAAPVAPRRVKRPRRTTRRVAAAAAVETAVTPASVAAPVIATINLPTATVTSTRPAPASTGTPQVSGPSPVGDLRGDVDAVLSPTPVSRPVRIEPTAATQLLLGDALSGTREAAQAAFSDALSHLVTTLSAADGRPESELERARLRKFLQISRIYLDNLAVKLKD